MDYYQQNLDLYYEKRAARATGNKMGLGVLMVSIISMIAQTVFMILVRINPAILEAYQTDSVFQMLYSAAVTVPGFLLGGLVIVKLENRKTGEFILFKKPSAGSTGLLLMMGLGFCMVANLATSVLSSVLTAIGFAPQMTDIEMPTDPFGILIYYFGVAVLPAFVEEFLYRGAVFSAAKKFGTSAAIIVSSVTFALMHGNLVQIPFAFFVGLFLGFAVAETGSTWPAVLIHFCNNFISCTLQFLEPLTGTEMLNFIYLCLMAVLLALSLLGAYLYFKKRQNAAGYPPTQHVSGQKKLALNMLFSPVMIVFYVLTIINIAQQQLL